jgi:hypothetical protein
LRTGTRAITARRYRARVPLAVGFAPHSGWAIAVVIDGRTVVDRRRIEIVGDGEARQLFHAAVGRRDAAAFVEAGTRAVFDGAARALDALDPGVATAGICGSPRNLPALDVILGNHMLLHAAEGDLYRAALEDACAARGWPVVQVHPKALEEEAATWKGAAPAPWQADHRRAAAVALRSVGP